LIEHKSSLTLYLTTLNTGSLGRIEQKLDELIANARAERKADTVLSLAEDDVESEMQWDLWTGALAEEGISKAELEGHKPWIKATLSQRIKSGELEEQLPDRTSNLQITARKDSSERRHITTSQPVVEDVSEGESIRQCGQPFGLARKPYYSNNSCLPTDFITQVGITDSKRPSRNLASSRRPNEEYVPQRASQPRDDIYSSSRLLESANQEGHIQPLWPQFDPALEYPWSAEFIFNRNGDNPQNHQPETEDTAKEVIRPKSRPCSLLGSPEMISTIGKGLWPSSGQLSHRHDINNASPSGEHFSILEAVTRSEASPAVPHRNLNITSESVSSSSPTPTSRRIQPDSSLEITPPIPPSNLSQHASQRLSINTNGDSDSSSTSNRFSQACSKRWSTISSITLHPFTPTGSNVKRASANYEFIKAATRASKDDIRNISSWSRLPHVRSFLDKDTIETALIELSMNPKNEKEKCRVEAVKSLVEHCGCCLECRDTKHQRTPLIWAILNGHEAIMRFLLTKGANLDATDGELLWTPLAWAAANGAWKATAILLKCHEAPLFINARDINGMTALDLAEAKKFKKTSETLRHHGAQCGVNSKSPLRQLVEFES
jgi:hypothetical protein